MRSFSPLVQALSVGRFLGFAETFQFDVILLVYFFFCYLCFWCHIQEIIAKAKVRKIYPVFSSGSVTVPGLTFKSLSILS